MRSNAWIATRVGSTLLRGRVLRVTRFLRGGFLTSRSYEVTVFSGDWPNSIAADGGAWGGRYCSTFRIARKAFWGISTFPTCFMRFLPSFCFSRSLRFRLMSPP